MARLTLDQINRENRAEPFEFEFPDGAVFTFRDPKALHYKQLATLDPSNADESMRAILGKDYDEFTSRPEVDGYLLESIMSAYVAHYGLGEPPEGSASPR